METKKIDGDLVVESFEFDGNLVVTGKIEINLELKISGNIKARDIKARDINARDINARNINAGNINAGNINAGDINAGDINAWDINAGNINAGNINAWNIRFYAVCFAYIKIVCKSIIGSRKNSKYFALDEGVVIKQEEE